MLLSDVISYRLLIFLGKPTLQSSTHHPYESDNGVNGDYTDTTATTIDNEKPYWRVDLQAVCIVVGVRVFNNERCELLSTTTCVHKVTV